MIKLLLALNDTIHNEKAWLLMIRLLLTFLLSYLTWLLKIKLLLTRLLMIKLLSWLLCETWYGTCENGREHVRTDGKPSENR